MATVESKKTKDFTNNCISRGSEMLKLPIQHVWLDSDEEAGFLIEVSPDGSKKMLKKLPPQIKVIPGQKLLIR
ncbi:MAG: hypothetical protein HQM08_06490 [Candidatus Riflebacteria bacterium]|nr:hypothetical protein [Candidatus Riflebacteria bacterium]